MAQVLMFPEKKKLPKHIEDAIRRNAKEYMGLLCASLTLLGKGGLDQMEHGDIVAIHQRTQLVDLLGREKLGFIGDDNVEFSRFGIFLRNILLGCDHLRAALQADAAADNVRAVAVVGAGLDEPNSHVIFLVVILCNQSLRRLGRAHCTRFEV